MTQSESDCKEEKLRVLAITFYKRQMAVARRRRFDRRADSGVTGVRPMNAHDRHYPSNR